MSDDQAQRVYAEARLGQGFALGSRPAVLVVDFSCGFTDPNCTVGADLSDEIDATCRLLEVARARSVPVIFTTIGYEPSGRDGGIWLQKFPALIELQVGERTSELDPRLDRRSDELVLMKKGASAFFGTNLSAILVSHGVDTVVLCGTTTSGCIRATAIDLLQHGFPALVPRECVGDRARAPHEANLFDIQAKYADVVSLSEAISYLEGVRARVGAVA
jgi:maleamate amidohydrolase